MKLLRTLLADLRERQILPAVVVLGVLALAIPIGASALLGKVTTPPAPPSGAAPFKPAKGVVPPVQELTVLNGTSPAQPARTGTPRNPFYEGSGTAASSSSTPTPTTTRSSSSSPPSSATKTKSTTTSKPSSSTSSSKSSTTTSKPSTPSKPKSSTTTTPKTTTTSSSSTTLPEGQGTPAVAPATLKLTQAYTVDINTQDAQGAHQLKNVVRLAPLPAAQSPELIFLGVLKGGKKAVFMFTNAIQVSGGTSSSLTCLPDNADCQIIELAPGQGMKLAPTSNTALIATFTFDVASIGVADYSSAAAAKGARDAVSSDGQTLLPLTGSTELGAFHFDDAIGALVYSPHNGPTGSTGTTGTTGTAEVPPSAGVSGGHGATTGGSSELAPTLGTAPATPAAPVPSG